MLGLNIFECGTSNTAGLIVVQYITLGFIARKFSKSYIVLVIPYRISITLVREDYTEFMMSLFLSFFDALF